MTAQIDYSKQTAYRAGGLLINANKHQVEADRLRKLYSEAVNGWADQERAALGIKDNEVWRRKGEANRHKPSKSIRITGHRARVNIEPGHPPFIEMLILVSPAKYSREEGLIHTRQWPIAKLLAEYEPTGSDF